MDDRKIRFKKTHKVQAKFFCVIDFCKHEILILSSGYQQLLNVYPPFERFYHPMLAVNSFADPLQSEGPL